MHQRYIDYETPSKGTGAEGNCPLCIIVMLVMKDCHLLAPQMLRWLNSPEKVL